jgi:ABC-type iron transport system FetAB ATPase subunit
MAKIVPAKQETPLIPHDKGKSASPTETACRLISIMRSANSRRNMAYPQQARDLIARVGKDRKKLDRAATELSGRR